MVGAVAGTPGTLPTNWSELLGGLTREIVGTGVSNGVNYIDIRLSGTTNTTSLAIALESSTQVAAVTGQLWAQSAWLSIVGGSVLNITALFFNYVERTSAGGAVAQQNSFDLKGLIGNTFARYSGPVTLSGGATTAFVQPRLILGFDSGAAIDITLRIGLPQLEQGAFATSVIPTTTAAVTRSADVASITGSAFSSWYRQDEGTFYSASSILGRNQAGGVNYANGIFKVRNDTANSSFSRTHHYYIDATQTIMAGSRDASGISFLSDTGVTITAQTIYSMASAYTNATIGLPVSVNGRTPVQDNFATINLTGLTTLLVGAGYFGAIAGAGVPTGDNMFLNGHIRRLCYWNQRLPNNVLQQITQ
jgi:hypothetical protein